MNVVVSTYMKQDNYSNDGPAATWATLNETDTV